MKKFLLNIILILLTVNSFSQEIVGKFIHNESGIPLERVSVSISDKYGALTDSTGQFILKYETQLDTVDILVIYPGFSKILIKGIPSSQKTNLGELKLLKVPVRMNVQYSGISKLKNRIYQRRDKKRYKKAKRNFVFQDTWISTSTGGYWMRKSEKEYDYVVNFNELK